MQLPGHVHNEECVENGKPVRPQPFTFNPPPASEMVENLTPEEPARLPYELRRVYTSMSITLRGRYIGKRLTRAGEPDTRPVRYYAPCKRYYSRRAPCVSEIEVYKVATGTTRGKDGITHQEYVYYWPDTAIVVETGTAYSVRVVQAGFCSMKCLSLWAAKIARDTEG